MAIYRVITGTVVCDNCGKLLAHVRFDAADTISMERVDVLCVDCHAAKEDGQGGQESE